MSKIIHTRSVPEGKDTNGLWLGAYYPFPMNCHTTRSYQMYYDLKRRTKGKTVGRKSYRECTNDFLDFQEFATFCNSEFGFDKKFGNRFWSIDKDILIKGNKSYNPETCIFVPSDINMIFVNQHSTRGEYPLGVTHHNTGPNPLLASYKDRGKTRYCGLFNDPLEAHRCWQRGKISTIRDMTGREDIIGHVKLINALLLRAQLIEDDFDAYRETIEF